MCLSTGGYPSPFPGLWSQFLSRGYPSETCISGKGYPSQACTTERIGYPFPKSGWGYAFPQPRWGYFTSLAGGIPSSPGQDGGICDKLSQDGSTSYAAGSTPLAVTQEDSFFIFHVKKVAKSTFVSSCFKAINNNITTI